MDLNLKFSYFPRGVWSFVVIDRVRCFWNLMIWSFPSLPWGSNSGIYIWQYLRNINLSSFIISLFLIHIHSKKKKSRRNSTTKNCVKLELGLLMSFLQKIIKKEVMLRFFTIFGNYFLFWTRWVNQKKKKEQLSICNSDHVYITSCAVL